MVIVRASSAEKKLEMARYVLSKVKTSLNLKNNQPVGFCLCIPQSAIAPIIGAKGEKIRDIIETSGVDKIDIPKSASFGSDFVIRILGDVEPTLVATKMVYQVIQIIGLTNGLHLISLRVIPYTFCYLVGRAGHCESKSIV